MKRFLTAAAVLFLTLSRLEAMGMGREADFDIGEFHSLHLAVPCTMTLVRGASFGMDIEDRNNRIDQLEIYNDQGTLVFKQKEKNLLRLIKKDDIHITLTMPVWKSIHVSSSADLRSREYWENDDISLKASASGDISLGDIQAGSAEIRVSGSGDIITGRLDLNGPLELTASSSGNIEADGVSCASVKVKNSASGEIDLGDIQAPEGSLQVKSSGSGDSSFGLVQVRNAVLNTLSSGEIRAEIISDSMEVKSSGSGDISLTGRTGLASVKTSGSGSVNAQNMDIDEAVAAGSGSGDIILAPGTRIRESRFSGSGQLIIR
ncbi:MAG: DUF2807 domain-containing protein [Spirochaetales bacterium]|nr:DUF2807 domain-containing protein [Spirochaetales bacterium]